ncbi:MAG: hypothetical protein R3E77_10280 [Steroidobacteraceae bacterium]
MNVAAKLAADQEKGARFEVAAGATGTVETPDGTTLTAPGAFHAEAHFGTKGADASAVAKPEVSASRETKMGVARITLSEGKVEFAVRTSPFVQVGVGYKYGGLNDELAAIDQTVPVDEE